MKQETLRHREAFEYYYSLGEKKSLTLVARKFNVSKQTVTKWNKAFNWQQRVEQRDIENGKRLEKKTDNAVVNSKAEYRALIRKTVDVFKERLKEGKIKISRPQDLESLAKLDLLMMGEATERNEDITINFKDE
jgi:transposase